MKELGILILLATVDVLLFVGLVMFMGLDLFRQVKRTLNLGGNRSGNTKRI